MKDLGNTRKDVLEEAYKLGVLKSSETAINIALAVGETIADCRIHGGCEKIDISVAKVSKGIDIKIVAPCYSEPDLVKRWFDCDCMNVAPNEENGRGCGIARSVTNEIQYHSGVIDLIFNLSPVEQALAGA